MSITFNCPCGKVLRVKDENVGKRVKCPECSHISVAEAEPEFEVVEDDDPPPQTRAASSGRKVVAVVDEEDDEDDRPRRKRREDEDDDDDERASRKRRRRDEDDEDDRPRRKKKPRKKKAREKEKPQSFGMERGIANSGVAGGLLAILVAVVWFVIGIMNDRIFIYPPILLIVGIVAMIKGMVGGSDD